MNEIHSKNQGQKNTRSISLVPRGSSVPIVNQMPTPVTAPTLVMSTAASFNKSCEKAVHWLEPRRQPKNSLMAIMPNMPTATPCEKNT